MPEVAYVNGRYSAIGDATVSIDDRGFVFGDGIYEVVVAYGGKLFLFEPHMQRLRRSAAAIRLEYDFDKNPLEPIVTEALRRSELSDAMVYIQLTRGVAPRDHPIPKGITPSLIMTVRPLPRVSDELRRRGARIMTVPDTRWSKCFVKAITLLPNVLARSEADDRGYDDALFVSPDGDVRECTSSNIFFVADGRLVTPTRDESVLHGITQNFLWRCAKHIGVQVAEQAFTLDTLCQADEVFLSNTSVQVLGVTSIDDRTIGDGCVGSVTMRLADEFTRHTGERSKTP